MPSGNVIVEQYNPSWPSQFETIKSSLSSYLASLSVLSIEHVGSTSVPGLAAKPIIDIDIIVTRENLQAAIDCLKVNRFMYLGELGIQDRHAFQDPNQDPKRNIYLCIDGATQTRNHLGVRDILRTDSELRNEYARVKMELSGKGTNIVEYIEAKSPILQKILRETGLLSEKELSAINEANRKGGRFGVVQTGREGLVLREFVFADEDAFLGLESIEEVVRYQTWSPRTREQAKELVAEIIRNAPAVPRSHIELAVEFKGTFIGRVGTKIAESSATETLNMSTMNSIPRRADLWFAFLPSYQGKGLATEAINAFLLLLKGPLELEIECDPRNLGSMKMADRLGFDKISQDEGVFECKGEHQRMAPSPSLGHFVTHNLRTIETTLKECSICKEPFDIAHQPVQRIASHDHENACSHVFGQSCLEIWITSTNNNSNKCPICRCVWFNKPQHPSITAVLQNIMLEGQSLDMSYSVQSLIQSLGQPVNDGERRMDIYIRQIVSIMRKVPKL
ncbi:UPF0157-domain-containing protein [Massarina eburnea CBS 473.64]|uniref:UPF0157-domain-containing protein n=1 Tax=Massarina eburnea CBS 473.64 TaxID=1395130 RepID=A0A6A6S8V0_9PLEO|nr:UPF0157-domain-containing protein [Massarina eburnea CBS 473.64]